MVHETLVLYVLAAGLIWTHLRRNSGRLWVKLALLCLVALGCLSHQLGFLVPLLVCIICVATTRPPLPVAARLFAVSGAASLAYGLWLRTFQTGLPLPHGIPEVIARLAHGESVPLVMQALSFPLIPVLVALGFQQPVVETGMAVMIAGAIVLLLSCAVAIRARKLFRFFFRC